MKITKALERLVEEQTFTAFREAVKAYDRPNTLPFEAEAESVIREAEARVDEIAARYGYCRNDHGVCLSYHAYMSGTMIADRKIHDALYLKKDLVKAKTLYDLESNKITLDQIESHVKAQFDQIEAEAAASASPAT